ncbi:MAG TPA: glycosyltransferase, partial [Acidimicrobiales bacterium]|nr:glycosyltransferase [Acidimicrobiales bacterium]
LRDRGPGAGAGAALAVLGPTLRRWDRRAAATAHRYVVNSREVRRRVADLYGIEAEVVPPPVAIDDAGDADPPDGLSAGYVLCVSRLLPYKNVEAVIDAFGRMPDRQLVVVGSGPLFEELSDAAPHNVVLLGTVSDASLRWLYRHSVGLVAASYEDFGLTPLEAATFGRPTAALRFGGFLDTVVEDETGVFFDEPEPHRIGQAVERLCRTDWDAVAIQAHAGRFSVDRFRTRMDALVTEERGRV